MDVAAGGASGSPASAVTASRHTSAPADSSLRIASSPFCEIAERASIAPIASDPASLFAHFWILHTAHEPHKSLAVCDRLLEVIDPADSVSHVRQANARAMSLRSLKRFGDAKAVHLAARPLLSAADPRIAGDHHHGLGLTFKNLGDLAAAFAELGEALRFYGRAESAYRVGLARLNTARLHVCDGHPELAFELIDRASEVEQLHADAETARAFAYDAQGDKPSARRAIANALTLLADSHNEATRAEALEVLNRIEGR